MDDDFVAVVCDTTKPLNVALTLEERSQFLWSILQLVFSIVRRHKFGNFSNSASLCSFFLPSAAFPSISSSSSSLNISYLILLLLRDASLSLISLAANFRLWRLDSDFLLCSHARFPWWAPGFTRRRRRGKGAISSPWHTFHFNSRSVLLPLVATAARKFNRKSYSQRSSLSFLGAPLRQSRDQLSSLVLAPQSFAHNVFGKREDLARSLFRPRLLARPCTMSAREDPSFPSFPHG